MLDAFRLYISDYVLRDLLYPELASKYNASP
jgi:hypothetical protein